jgi:hypothetical protein
MSKTVKIILVAVVVLAVLGAGGGALAWQQSKNPAFCANCHIIEPYYEGWEDSDLLAHAHAEAGVECKDCHVTTPMDAAGEAFSYVTGSYEDPLKERKFPMEECFVCHEHGSYEEIIEMTSDLEEEVGANPHDSHYGEMECYLCHKMHRPSEDYCAECHSFEWQVP